MTIAISADHTALADSVRSVADRVLPTGYLHAQLNAERLDDRPAHWAAVAEMGLLGLHIDEEYGGQGFGFCELVVAIEELGRSVAPGLFVPSTLAAAVISSSTDDGVRKNLLPSLADGSSTAAVTLDADVAGTIDDGVLTVSGTAAAVVGAQTADIVVLPAMIAGAERWIALESNHIQVTNVDSVDVLRPVGHVTVEAATGAGVWLLEGVATSRVRTVAGTLYAAEASGVASESTRIASEYAKVRTQFGRPIGQFQAIKHKCATMLVESERAAACAWGAARALDDHESTHAELTAAIAATLARRAAVDCAQNAIQALGGIGFTWEHDIHLYYRRALGIAAALGHERSWTASITRLAIDAGLPDTDIDMPAGTEARRRAIRAEVLKLSELSGREQSDALADGGWIVPHLPRPWGRAADPLDQVLIHQELGAARITRPDLALAAWMVPSLVAHGTREQQERYLPPTFRGEHFWCQLFSEPGAGSDLAALTTKAVKVDGGWQLSGSKVWNSLAQFADKGFCLARTNPKAPKHQGISYFLVDMKAAGVTVRPLRELTGSALFNEVFLDDVFVPDNDVVGEVDHGWEVARNTLSNERVSLGNKELPLYASVGALLKWARAQELDALATHRVGQLVADGYAVRVLNQRATIIQIDGADPGMVSSVSKLLNMKFGQDASEFVQAEFGHEGAVGDESTPAGTWAAYLLAGRATTIYGGTTEIQLNIIAERILGLPRDPAPVGQ